MTATQRPHRYSHLRRITLAALAALTALALSSCGSNADEGVATSTPTSAVPTTAPAEAASVDLSQQFSEQDIPAARAAIDAGQALWAATGPASYTLTIGLQSVSGIEHTVVDGVVVDSTIVTPITGLTVDEYPKTIDEVFATVDALIATFENDPALVPGFDECGNHVNIRFDPDLGYPSLYDELGPCDDGVGFFVEVVPAG